MQKFLFTALLAPFGAYGALAADLGKPPHIVDVPASFTWNGAYFGAHGGYSNYKAAWAFDPAFALATSDPRFGGALVGVHAGVQHQFKSNFVFGLEIDLQRHFADDSASIASFGVVVPITLETSLNWMGSARFRAGYAMDRWMPYVTGGVAIADYDVIGSIVPFLESAPHSELAVGWTAGVGAEYAMTDNVLLRGEYRYGDFGSVKHSALGLPDAYRLDTHQFTLSMNYKLPQ